MLNVPFNNGGCFNLSFYSLCVFHSYKNKRRAILNFSLSPIEAHAHRSIVFYRGTTLSLSYPYFLLVVIEASNHRPYVCPFLHSSVRLSDIRTLFYIILRHRDVFRFIFTSFVMYFRPFHITFLIALPPLSIYNFTSNNHSFFLSISGLVMSIA